MTSRRIKMVRKLGKIAFIRKLKMKQSPTKSEKILWDFLKKFNIPCNFQKIIFTPHGFYIIDFVIMMKPRTIIEVDGKSHIGREKYDKNRIKEILRLSPFKKHHWGVVRIKNEEVLNGKAFEIIKELYKKRRNFNQTST